MKILTALGLTAALVIAGCAEPVASIVPMTPSPSNPIPNYEKPSEVMPATCEKLEATFAKAFGAALEWRKKRLSNEEFEEVLSVINNELSWAGFEKDTNGFYFPTMPLGAEIDYSPAIRPLSMAHLSLSAVISVGVSDYRFVKENLKEAKEKSTRWMDFYCDDAD